MTATYTFDVFMSLDGYGAHSGDWGGYWGKQGPELLARRLALYQPDQHMVFGATTYRAHAGMLAQGTEAESLDPWVTRMRDLPATIVSSTLRGAARLAGDTWRMDFSRFNQRRADTPAEDSGGWAWSPHGVWDSHVPELFPYVHFSHETVGE